MKHAEGWQFCFLPHIGKYKVRVSTSDEDVSEASLNAATHSPVPSSSDLLTLSFGLGLF